MRLSPETQAKIKAETGLRANEACDACGQLLGSVRYTRRAEPGEWCSEACRDGVAVATANAQRTEARRVLRAGRPVKHKTESARRWAKARYQRAFRLKQRQNAEV